jgi:imidazolonepropionase
MNLLIKNIKQLVTVRSNGRPYKSGTEMRDLGIIENATVMIQDGLFSWIGPSTTLEHIEDDSIDTIDASDFIALPGFIDSHTHTVFAGSRENEFAMRTEGKTYREIADSGGGILSTVSTTRDASKKELKKLASRHLDAILKQGTTTVEIKSGYGLNEDTEIKILHIINELAEEGLMNIVPTFFGAHAIPDEFKKNPEGYVDLICKRMLPYIANHKMAKFCDAFCEQGYFSVEQCRIIFETAKSLNIGVKIHADQFSQIGASKLAAEIGAISADHLDKIDDAGIYALEQSGAVATVLPGSSFFLNCGYAPARKIIDSGIPLAIASNFNPGSCMSYSMQLMMTIACTQMSLTPEEAICAATINGAASLGLTKSLGSIEVGKQADIILYNAPNYQYLIYHYGINHVAKVIKSGIYLVF